MGKARQWILYVCTGTYVVVVIHIISLISQNHAYTYVCTDDSTPVGHFVNRVFHFRPDGIAGPLRRILPTTDCLVPLDKGNTRTAESTDAS